MATTSAKKFQPNSPSDLKITIQDGPNAAGAIFLHEQGDCIMLLFDEEFAAVRVALGLAEKTKRNWKLRRSIA